jgi:hypothetical protein
VLTDGRFDDAVEAFRQRNRLSVGVSHGSMAASHAVA